MPRPGYYNKINSRSAKDKGNENDFERQKSEISMYEHDCKRSLKSDTAGIVKSLLGPSLEDAVLRTLEFGKSLMQKSDLEQKQVSKDKKLVKKFTKGNKDFNLEALLGEQNNLKGIGNGQEKEEEKNISLLKLNRDQFIPKTNSPIRKPMNVSKIRSLDSDLKQNATSPEKIKKQLEALIQINKNELPERSWNLITSKTPKIPMEMTVMPSLCMYKNEAEMNYSSSYDVQSQPSRAAHVSNETSRVNINRDRKKRSPNKICQAPEFLSNALGPTIDVSIIDNLKMMRDIFKNDSGKGEGNIKENISQPANQHMKQEIRLQNSEGEMTGRIEALQKKIEELEQKEQYLLKQIEEEENERESRRRAFAEEQRKVCQSKHGLDTLPEEKKKATGKSLMELNADGKHEALQSRIAIEEDRLSRLKCQCDQYKRQLVEAKCKKEALKRNKCLLDAWDIFASRVCHTKLPSFSRAYNLERKQLKSEDPMNLHCCFPTVTNTPDIKKTTSAKSCIQPRCGRGETESERNLSRDEECFADLKCKLKMGEIQFPIQRDIVCGLHQMLKTCTCSSKSAVGGQICSSEDDMLKKYRGSQGTYKNSFSNSLGIESSAEMLMRKASGDKGPCRSKSDTSLKKDKCSKIVKVMWAVARINIFQNNYRTYEIMDATSKPPSCLPAKTEGIFVVKTNQKNTGHSPRKKCCSRAAGLN